MAVVQPANRTPHAGFRVVLHVAHVGEQRCATVLAGGAFEFPDAASVGSQLRAQVGEVLLRVARRVVAGRKRLPDAGLVEPPVAQDARRLEQRAFVVDVAGCPAASSQA